MRMQGMLVLVLALMLGGCGVRNLWRGDTERFEEALPLPDTIVKAKTKLDAAVPGEGDARDRMGREYDIARSTRAKKCLQGDLSTFDSADDIRAKVEPDCLADANEALLGWTQSARLRVLLSLPPLIAPPKEQPKFIATSFTPAVFGMAKDSPVLVVSHDRKLEVLDAVKGKTLFTGKAQPDRTFLLAPSPNGRVFASVELSTVVIRESLSGDELASFTGYRTFKWLDSTTGMMNDAGLSQRVIFDGRTGEITQSKGLTSFNGTIVSVGGNPESFVVSGFSKLAKFELTHDAGPEVHLVEQHNRPRSSADNGNLLATSDGSHVVVVDAKSVVVADSETLDLHSFETGLFNPMWACALDDPDEVLIMGGLRDRRRTDYSYVFSIENETLAPVEDDRLLNSRGGGRECPVRFDALDGVYIKFTGGFQRLDDVKRGQPMGAGAWEAHFSELQAAEPERGVITAGGASYAERPPATSKPLLGESVRNADIQAVGVYEAENSSRGAGAGTIRTAGPVMVIVRASARPIVLVLSSYEAVSWNLQIMPGAKIEAILLGGYHTSTVSGAGDARIVTIRGYAYEPSSSGYGVLDSEVLRWTGRRIESFQGRYGGKTFMVGGR